jgi:hypothetical protein
MCPAVRILARSVAGAVLALAPAGAAAQVSIGIGAQLLCLGGNDFRSADAGFGGEASVLFPVGKSFKMGAAVQYSSHDDAFLDNNIAVLGLFYAGRFVFRQAKGGVTPYIVGRGGWVRASSKVDVDFDGTDDDVSQTGFAFGGGGGVMIPLSPSVEIDLGAAFHAVSLGDGKADGTTVPNTDASGTALQIRAGVSFKIGGASR